MATVSWTASPADISRLVNAMCGIYGYEETVGGAPNPESRGEFAHRRQLELWKVIVRDYEHAIKERAARAAVTPTLPPDIT